MWLDQARQYTRLLQYTRIMFRIVVELQPCFVFVRFYSVFVQSAEILCRSVSGPRSTGWRLLRVSIFSYILACRLRATIRPSQGPDYYVQYYISTSCSDTQDVQLIPRAARYKQNICDANDDRFWEAQAPFQGNRAGRAGAWNFIPCKTMAMRVASCSCPALEEAVLLP